MTPDPWHLVELLDELERRRLADAARARADYETARAFAVRNVEATGSDTKRQAPPIVPIGAGQAHTPAMHSELLTVGQVAEVLRLDERTVQRRIAGPTPELPSVKVGAARRIRRTDLDAYLEQAGTS